MLGIQQLLFFKSKKKNSYERKEIKGKSDIFKFIDYEYRGQ